MASHLQGATLQRCSACSTGYQINFLHLISIDPEVHGEDHSHSNVIHIQNLSLSFKLVLYMCSIDHCILFKLKVWITLLNVDILLYYNFEDFFVDVNLEKGKCVDHFKKKMKEQRYSFLNPTKSLFYRKLLGDVMLDTSIVSFTALGSLYR